MRLCPFRFRFVVVELSNHAPITMLFWRSLIRPPFDLVSPNLGCIFAMHAAIGLTMGLYLLALVMIVMNLAAFGVPSRAGKHRRLQ